MFVYGGGAISWSSKKQTCKVNSTMTSEFIEFASTENEAKWLRSLIFEIPLSPKPISPVV